MCTFSWERWALAITTVKCKWSTRFTTSTQRTRWASIVKVPLLLYHQFELPFKHYSKFIFFFGEHYIEEIFWLIYTPISCSHFHLHPLPFCASCDLPVSFLPRTCCCWGKKLSRCPVRQMTLSDRLFLCVEKAIERSLTSCLFRPSSIDINQKSVKVSTLLSPTALMHERGRFKCWTWSKHLNVIGQVCLMIHCGSRGLGHQVATDSLVAMEKAMKRDQIEVNDRQLACARISSQEGYYFFLLPGLNCTKRAKFMIL